jgi:ABC-type transporter Mla MlaB component
MSSEHEVVDTLLMSESAEPSQAQHSAVLEVNCLTIAECALVADQLRTAMSRHPKVFMNLANCDEIDTAGMQLLTIIQNDGEVANRIRFVAPHEAVFAQAKRLGLSSFLQSGVDDV